MPGSLVTVCCSKCNLRVKVDIENAKWNLRRLRRFGFGKHVGDPRAFVMRLMTIERWQYTGDRIAKSTVSMVCPDCLDPEALVLDADVA